ncbi:MAG: M28 family metallopeptidase [Acidobacteriota bacterium]|nr:M28 family metallopeptidase [Acidobacteriota bacterium]
MAVPVRRTLAAAAAAAVLLGGAPAGWSDPAAPVAGDVQQEAPPPEARGRNAYRPTVWPADEDYLRWPLPRGAERYRAIDGGRIRADMEALVAISRKSRDGGNQYWGRITGTAADKEATDWMAGQFRRIGLERVRIQEFALPPQWFPTSWRVSAAIGEQAVELESAFPLFNSVGIAPVELEPAWVGTGTAADFQGRDVRGKAVVAYGFPNPGGRTNTALTNGVVATAERAGAAALFVILGFPGNVKNIPQAGGKDPPARMPVFMLGNDDGNRLRAAIEQGESPRLQVRLDVEYREGLRTASVWGELRGASDEHIAVMAHTDAFFDGALDNGSGLGTLLELARFYAAQPAGKRPRTMTFFTTSAHHAYAGEEAGIVWIKKHRQDLLRRTALLVNLEHTSQVQTYLMGRNLVASNTVSARRWYVGGTERLQAIARQAFRDFGIALYAEPERRPGGELSKVYMDAPGVHIIDHAIYHTDLDTPQHVPTAGLEAAGRAFARIIDEANALTLVELRGNTPAMAP